MVSRLRVRLFGCAIFALSFGGFAGAAQASHIEPGPRAGGTSELAFTGLNTGLVVALGVTLLATGVLLRRRVRPS